MRFITDTWQRTIVLGAVIVALLAAPSLVLGQEDVTEELSRALSAREEVRELAGLAKERAQDSRTSAQNAEAWSKIARAAWRTSEKYAYASQLFANAANLRANGKTIAADKADQKGDELFAKAEDSREAVDQAFASMEQGNFNKAIILARNIQPEPQPEGVEAVVAGGPGEAAAEEVAAGGPGAAALAVPDFAPAELASPTGTASAGQ